ncbi:hypothetical protein VE25_07500 [Devosia geojensis]|uniref:Arc-like DNA binding domain-containing protein n=1 Tax=Devosia geojensis TaxID=443610 RepID=A0A0F5FU80_9HYPH|nr:Arc family DNA-binding protein [Devosia geojensis]KKB12388.1 hypothetical protein VE25_07500 [Devosia geojensis]
MAQPKQTDPQFKLRLTPDLKAQIEGAAQQNNRSMNAEIVARLESSFQQDTAALREATLVAESLRKNLTEKIENYDKLLSSLTKRTQILDKREAALDEREFELSMEIDNKLAEREHELEKEYEALMERARQRWEQADEYAGFTIARERQFIETIKALTGKEPPPAEPVPPTRKK